MASLPRTKLQDYLFFENNHVRTLFDQLPEDAKRTTREQSKEVGLSIAGPSVKMSESARHRPATPHEQISAIREHLKSSGDLAARRPITMREGRNEPRFVEESMIARKVILPEARAGIIPGLKSIAIWVSDPDPRDLSLEEDYRFTGTFVYLVESFWDRGERSTVYSGCSALQAIANAALGSESLFQTRNEDEPFGRDTYEHPVDKFRPLGALTQAPRRIRSLYRVRHITDEQCWTFNGLRYRVNDLLGYPLYITAE